MGYNILRFKHNGTKQWGVLKGDQIAPFGEDVDQLKEILADHMDAARALSIDASAGSIDLNAVDVISPVTRPTRLLCLGLNYYCLLYTSPSPRDATLSRMPSSA